MNVITIETKNKKRKKRIIERKDTFRYSFFEKSFEKEKKVGCNGVCLARPPVSSSRFLFPLLISDYRFAPAKLCFVFPASNKFRFPCPPVSESTDTFASHPPLPHFRGNYHISPASNSNFQFVQ